MSGQSWDGARYLEPRQHCASVRRHVMLKCKVSVTRHRLLKPSRTSEFTVSASGALQ